MLNVTQVIRLSFVMQMTGLSRSSIYNRITSKSPWYDPTFPKQIRLTSGGKRGAVGWFKHEIEEWILSRKGGLS